MLLADYATGLRGRRAGRSSVAMRVAMTWRVTQANAFAVSAASD